MRIKFLDNLGGRCYIEDFLSGLDEETHYKISKKLEDFELYDWQHLFRAEHIKKLEDNLHEIRVRIKKKCYRFLGWIDGEVFNVVHVYHKKTGKLPLKEIRTAKSRLNTD